MEFAFIFLLCSIIFLLIYLKKPDDLIILLMFSIFIINWLADGLYILPHASTWLIELIIFFLFLISLFPKMISINQIDTGPFGTMLISLIIFSVFGSFIHFISIFDFLLGIRYLFKYVFFYFILINLNLGLKEYKRIFKYWIMMVSLQPFIGGYQHFVEGKIADQVFGTLLSNSFQPILLITLILYLLDQKFESLFWRFSKYIIIILSLTIIPLYGEVKAFFYFFPLALFIKNLHSIKNLNFLSIIKISSAALIGIAILQTLFFNIWKVQLFDFKNISLNDFSFAQGAESISSLDNNQASIAISLSERLLTLLALYNFISEDKSRIVFGDGLGSNIFTYDTRNDFTRQQIGGISGQELYIKKFTIGRIIQNIGVIGFLLLLFIIYRIGAMSYKISQRKIDPFLKTIYQMIPVFSVIFIIYIFYSDPFSDAISFTYWFLISSLRFEKIDN